LALSQIVHLAQDDPVTEEGYVFFKSFRAGFVITLAMLWIAIVAVHAHRLTGVDSAVRWKRFCVLSLMR